MTREEKETIIRFDESSDTATVYTCNASIRKRLNEIEKANLAAVHKISGGNTSSSFVEYEIPKSLIAIKKPRKKRVLSEKEKNTLSERLRHAREEKFIQ